MTEFKPPPSADEAGRALHEALVKAQAALETVKRDREAGTGGGRRYQYATLDQILQETRKPLSDNGLAVMQWLTGEGLRTELRHTGGGVLSHVFPWPSVPENPQELGKLITYLRRYSYASMLQIATEDDDDAQAPKDSKPKAEKPKKISESQRGQIDVALAALIAKAPTHEGQLSWPAQLREKFQVQTKEELTSEQADAAIAWLGRQAENAGVPF